MRKLTTVLYAVIALFPSWLKVLALRGLGAKIGKGCYIGLSLVDAREIAFGDHVRIGHFNLIKSVRRLKLDSGSKIESFNWITGAGSGEFVLGAHSSVRRFHFFEVSGSFYVGANCIIAGRSSLFFTHGLSPENWADVRPITLGDWSYIGAAARFLPGSGVAEGTFVGMGAVITKSHSEPYVLIGGSPGKVIRKISPDAIYYQRGPLRHAHHPKGWTA